MNRKVYRRIHNNEFSETLYKRKNGDKDWANWYGCEEEEVEYIMDSDSYWTEEHYK